MDTNNFENFLVVKKRETIFDVLLDFLEGGPIGFNADIRVQNVFTLRKEIITVNVQTKKRKNFFVVLGQILLKITLNIQLIHNRIDLA